MFIFADNLRSESVGPIAGLWWASDCSLGDVCYLHWAHVHPGLHCQTTQICHPVSTQASFAFDQMCPAYSLSAVTESSQADAQWHIPHWSSRTAMRTHATLRILGMPPLARARPSAATNGDDVPLDLSSHHEIVIGPSSAIMRAQGSARCRVQMALSVSDYATRRTLALTNMSHCRWSMGSVLFLGAWGVLMGPIQYCKPASFP
jgi:hypothetical protein